MLKVVLCCSLLANLVLSVFVVSETAPRGSTSATRFAAAFAPAAGAALRPAAPAVAGGTAAAYYGGLLSLGLSPDEGKTLLRARLERAAFAAVNPPADIYWRDGVEARLDHALALIDAESHVRSQLLALFGRAAESDPSFATLFRPLDPHLAFLDSGSQLDLRRFRLERQLANAARLGRLDSALGMTTGADPDRGAPRPAAADVESVLEGDALLEYELRESPTAERLRAAVGDLSEDGFREVFALLRAIERGDGGVRGHLDARAALQRVLGPRAFARLWATRDPVFGVVARAGAQRGWDEDTVLDAYGVLASYDEQLLDAVDTGAEDIERLAARARDLDADALRKLAALLGDEPAAALLQSRSAYRFSANQAGFTPRDGDVRR